MHAVPSSPRQFRLLPTNTTYTSFGTDSSSYEMGVYFFVDVPGVCVGVRWYKSPAAIVETGHTVNLWSPGGLLLTSAAQVNETVSGWQEQHFLDPYPITAGGVYCVSRNIEVATNDPYPATNGFYAVPLNNAPVHAPGTAGRYITTPGAYPNASVSNFDFGVEPVLLL